MTDDGRPRRTSLLRRGNGHTRASGTRSSPRSGRGGRRFKSCHSDQISRDLAMSGSIGGISVPTATLRIPTQTRLPSLTVWSATGTFLCIIVRRRPLARSGPDPNVGDRCEGWVGVVRSSSQRVALRRTVQRAEARLPRPVCNRDRNGFFGSVVEAELSFVLVSIPSVRGRFLVIDSTRQAPACRL